MNLVTRTAILDAVIDAFVIRGALTAPSGARRDFHGWLQPTQRGTRFRCARERVAPGIRAPERLRTPRVPRGWTVNPYTRVVTPSTPS